MHIVLQQMAKAVGTSLVSVDAEQQIEALAREIATFMGLDWTGGVKALPPPPAAGKAPPPSTSPPQPAT